MNLESFEELDAWNRSMKLSERIYEVTKTKKFSRDPELKDQIRRSSLSIPSNVAEGFERTGDQEFLRFLSIAKGSAGELRTQIMLADRLDYVSESIAKGLVNEAVEISKLLSGLIRYLKDSEDDN